MEPGQTDLRQEEDVSDRLLAIHVGMDLAMSWDYTAVAVAQVRERLRLNAPAGQTAKETYYRMQQVRRWPHNLAAPEIATGLVELFTLIHAELISELEGGRIHGFNTPDHLPPCSVYIDSTGLGKAIVPSIRQALGDCRETKRVSVRPMTFTHGEKYNPFHYDAIQGGNTVGKTHLITNLQALLHADRLDLPKRDPQSQILRQEIDVYRLSISQDGKETFGAMSVNHDDLVTALALCCLDDPRLFEVTYTPYTW